MRVLAIETATAHGAIALLGVRHDPIRRPFPVGLHHGRHVLVEIDRIVRGAGLRPRGVELVAVDRGPGSYTGIRVGVTAAKAIAYALGIPVVGVEGTRVLGEAVPEGSGWIAPVIDARRREVYGALFDRSSPPRAGGFDAFVGPPAELARRLPRDARVFGDGLDAYPEIFRGFPRGPAPWGTPDPAVVGRLGLEGFRRRGGDDAVALEPIYLRPSEAEIRLRERRRRAARRGEEP